MLIILVIQLWCKQIVIRRFWQKPPFLAVWSARGPGLKPLRPDQLFQSDAEDFPGFRKTTVDEFVVRRSADLPLRESSCFRTFGAREPRNNRSILGQNQEARGTITNMLSVQIFGLKNSQATRAAERFFKERRMTIHFVDLKQKPMSPGEIRRFIERFTLSGIVDSEGKAWAEAGLKYMKMSDAELLARIEREPGLLRLPLVRSTNRLSVGHDQGTWKTMTQPA
jgi:arsenate reductase (glutaredoxin)